MTNTQNASCEPIIPVVFEPKSEKQTEQTETNLEEQEKVQAEIEAEVKNAQKQNAETVN